MTDNAKQRAASGVENALYELEAPNAGFLGREECAVLAKTAVSALESDDGVALIEVPAPTDTYNHSAEMSMWGWEVDGAPYFVEFIPNAGSGQVELEHEGVRLTPMTADAALKLAAALIASATIANGGKR